MTHPPQDRMQRIAHDPMYYSEQIAEAVRTARQAQRPQRPSEEKSAGPWGWAVGILAAAVLGFAAGFVAPGPQLNATTPVPAPVATATTVVEITRTASPSVSQSRNVQLLKLAWGQMPEGEKAGLRDGWRMAKAQGVEQVVIDMAIERLTSEHLRNLSEAEVREFLDWALDH